MNENVSAWLSAVEGLPAVHSRLKRVEIRNQDACDLIRELDSPDTLFYVDAPYIHETRATQTDYGRYEMSDQQHRDLVGTLSEISGKALVSMYHHKIYDDLATVYGWNLVEFNLPNNASSRKQKERKIECVWKNY
jgi:DNA adenine methylase